MTNPTESAPWWNLLLEIVALPAVNAALPFVFAAILAFVSGGENPRVDGAVGLGPRRLAA
jgi:hypothetical protein